VATEAGGLLLSILSGFDRLHGNSAKKCPTTVQPEPHDQQNIETASATIDNGWAYNELTWRSMEAEVSGIRGSPHPQIEDPQKTSFNALL